VLVSGARDGNVMIWDTRCAGYDINSENAIGGATNVNGDGSVDDSEGGVIRPIHVMR
jgi:hypothetical protein